MPAETDDPALRDLLDRQSAVITRAQALRHLTAAQIRHRLAARRWRLVHYGVYLAHSGPAGADVHRWVAVLGTVGGHAAWLGGLSALEAQGFRGFPAEAVHVLLPARLTAKNPPKGVIVHRTTLLSRADLCPVARPPGTTAARSLIDAAQWQHSQEQAAAIVLAGCQQRLARAEEVRRVLATMPRIRHRAVIRDAIQDASGGAESLPEAEFAQLCRAAGLPSPRMRWRRDTGPGRRNYLDAYFPDQRVHVEIDGGYHLDVRQWWADMRRQNALWIPGDRLLRFPSWAIRYRRAEVTAQLRAAIGGPVW
ncbi:endonuclease domain-containing protein [Actinoplanes hulinensis]|uniref:Endonuclease domain-containing protein n=1 Tax=Actinoplanes hulinensis TaxID=1144547 RepID=A0ABS7BBK4_9ACTN|nr:endonuclease domain-containing protein [Actinoplanes hulinensis]MBW6438277.1 endonuclease domain-containing protein [Actinoplanes hulinensis]